MQSYWVTEACNLGSVCVHLSINVNARTVKWAIGVVVILVVTGVGAALRFFVVGFISLEKASNIAGNFRPSWTREDGILARNRRCSQLRKVS